MRISYLLLSKNLALQLSMMRNKEVYAAPRDCSRFSDYTRGMVWMQKIVIIYECSNGK